MMTAEFKKRARPKKRRCPVTGEIAERLGEFPESIFVERIAILFAAGVSFDLQGGTVGELIRLLGRYPANTPVVRFVIELVDKQEYTVKIEF
jgi:hypothetical protein